MISERLHVSDDCRRLGLRAVGVVLRNVVIEPSCDDLRARLQVEVERIRTEFSAASEIRRLPEIARLHQILKAVGVKPKSHPPSTQKLLELALKRGRLPSVNNLVDAYNLVSVQTLCSLGAHDLDRIKPPVELALFAGDEPFRRLGGEKDEPVNAGEFGYRDASGRVLCRLDSRQAEFSKVTPATTNALLIIESTTSQDEHQWLAAVEVATRTVARYVEGGR